VSDRFRPLSMEQLTDWVFDELEGSDSLFGIPRAAFFVPSERDRFRSTLYGKPLETPFGVAAGPHTQMAQNIIVAWALGARVIELKTVQTLDTLEVHKPCIDVEDEGYNVEWSQELKVHESFEEYLRAWTLIHALHHRLGFPGERPGVLFDMSVGYDLAGIRQPNVQWYLDSMADAGERLAEHVEIVARRYPGIRDLAIPSRLSDKVTLSTMHGCPPDEIGRISAYLLTERGLHTSVKCNPTLLGAERVRAIINGELGYRDVTIPDEAFGHDLRYEDAVPMFHELAQVAAEHDRTFGLKLSNTLEVLNWRTVFPDDPVMYLSGRALHPITVNLAAALDSEFGGSLPLSFAGGADCFNATELLAAGLRTVTVCSDLLKTGGYLRLPQYVEQLATAMDETEATDLPDFVVRAAAADDAARFVDLRRYAERTRRDWRYQKASFRTDRSKTDRALGLFDCIAAPCVDECPVDQKVPQYMEAVRSGDFVAAVRIAREDNPLPAILGRVCDHHCEDTCVRTHLDQPLAIRHIKRFIMEQERQPVLFTRKPANGSKVAIIGAGPAGLSAAQELAIAGFAVTVFEAHRYPGGMVGGAIPAYRLPQASIDQDVALLERLGVTIRFGRRAGLDFTLGDLRAEGFERVLVAVGAQRAKRLGLEGEDAEGVIDALRFLRSVREGDPVPIGARVGVVGAGDTAMDAVRSALRVGAREASLIYRRTIAEMPADREEVEACREEGVRIVELARPHALHVEGGRLVGLVCARTELADERDASGRRIVRDIPGATFEIPLDTLILAISQHAVLDLFGETPPALTSAGYISVDPFTLESSVPGVYALGDVAADGPSSIVRAAADGKAAAAAIVAAHGQVSPEPAAAPATGAGDEPVDVAAMVMRRARREFRVPVKSLALEQRAGFAETALGYTAEEAMAEASRCLDCHRICSLCVSVCPNLALMTYRSAPLRAALPTLHVEAAGVRAGDRHLYRAEQALQIAVLTDLCNECGNCVTVCPTAGRPWHDKPRLYLDAADFEAQDDNAFRLLADGSMEARWGGETHRLSMNGVAEYTSPELTARLDPETFALQEASPGPAAVAGTTLSLDHAADMLFLHRGLRSSMPHLPRATAPAADSRISEPGGQR
jgi:putative selenate reductase